jgi:acyl carrier protein
VTKEEIFEKVRTMLVDTYQLDLQSVHPTAHLIDDLGLDSIDAIDLAVTIESETGIDVSEEELRSLRIVQDAVDLIYRRLGGG